MLFRAETRLATYQRRVPVGHYKSLLRLTVIFLVASSFCIYQCSRSNHQFDKTRRRLGQIPEYKNLKEAIDAAGAKGDLFWEWEFRDLQNHLRRKRVELLKEDESLEELFQRCDAIRIMMELSSNKIPIHDTIHGKDLTFKKAKGIVNKVSKNGDLDAQYNYLMEKYSTLKDYLYDRSINEQPRYWREQYLGELDMFGKAHEPLYLGVCQMVTGNCWFAAAAAAVARQQPNLLKDQLKAKRSEQVLEIFGKRIKVKESYLAAKKELFEDWGRHTRMRNFKPVRSKWYFMLELAMYQYCQQFWRSSDVETHDGYETLNTGFLYEGLAAITNYPTIMDKVKTVADFQRVQKSYWNKKYPMTIEAKDQYHVYAVVGMTTETENITIKKRFFGCFSVVEEQKHHYIHVFDPNNLTQNEFRKTMSETMKKHFAAGPNPSPGKIQFVSQHDKNDATLKVPVEMFKDVFGDICICIKDDTLVPHEITKDETLIKVSETDATLYKLVRPNNRNDTRDEDMRTETIKARKFCLRPAPDSQTTVWYKEDEFVREIDPSVSQGNSDTSRTQNAHDDDDDQNEGGNGV